jgi:hypothetical protein
VVLFGVLDEGQHQLVDAHTVTFGFGGLKRDASISIWSWK